MGIPGLLQVLKSVTHPVHVEEYRGLTVGVDAFCWLHRGTFSCSTELCTGVETDKHVEFCMKRVRLLQKHGVTPLMVFDGDSLPIKGEKHLERRRKREESRAKAEAALAAGEAGAAAQHFSKSVAVTYAMAHALIKALNNADVQLIVAPYEADAQLAHLSRTGAVDAIVTEDSDCLPYGCKKVLFKMDNEGNGQEIQLRNLCANENLLMCNWKNSMFLDMCLLVGCDYLPSIKGMGIVTAHKIVQRHRSLDKIIKALDASKLTVPDGYWEQYKKARLTFRHQVIFDVQNQCSAYLMPLGESAKGEESLDFLGTLLPPSIAQGVAVGHLEPRRHKPYQDKSLPNESGNTPHPPQTLQPSCSSQPVPLTSTQKEQNAISTVTGTHQSGGGGGCGIECDAITSTSGGKGCWQGTGHYADMNLECGISGLGQEERLEGTLGRGKAGKYGPPSPAFAASQDLICRPFSSPRSALAELPLHHWSCERGGSDGSNGGVICKAPFGGNGCAMGQSSCGPGAAGEWYSGGDKLQGETVWGNEESTLLQRDIGHPCHPGVCLPTPQIRPFRGLNLNLCGGDASISRSRHPFSPALLQSHGGMASRFLSRTTGNGETSSQCPSPSALMSPDEACRKDHVTDCPGMIASISMDTSGMRARHCTTEGDTGQPLCDGANRCGGGGGVKGGFNGEERTPATKQKLQGKDCRDAGRSEAVQLKTFWGGKEQFGAREGSLEETGHRMRLGHDSRMDRCGTGNCCVEDGFVHGEEREQLDKGPASHLFGWRSYPQPTTEEAHGQNGPGPPLEEAPNGACPAMGASADEEVHVKVTPLQEDSLEDQVVMKSSVGALALREPINANQSKYVPSAAQHFHSNQVSGALETLHRRKRRLISTNVGGTETDSPRLEWLLRAQEANVQTIEDGSIGDPWEASLSSGRREAVANKSEGSSSGSNTMYMAQFHTSSVDKDCNVEGGKGIPSFTCGVGNPKQASCGKSSTDVLIKPITIGKMGTSVEGHIDIIAGDGKHPEQSPGQRINSKQTNSLGDGQDNKSGATATLVSRSWTLPRPIQTGGGGGLSLLRLFEGPGRDAGTDQQDSKGWVEQRWGTQLPPSSKQRQGTDYWDARLSRC